MCGRYTLACPDGEALMRGLPYDAFSETRIEFKPRYNIAPGQRSPVIYLTRGGAVLADAHWGLPRDGGGLVINARSEDAERAFLFRDAYRDGRCVVPADGFLEWKKEGRINQPYLFRRSDGGLLLMAGLWTDERYVILTADSSGAVAEIHDRAPLLLTRSQAKQWLDVGTLAGEPPELSRTPVSTRINRIENDDPSCVAVPPQASFQFD